MPSVPRLDEERLDEVEGMVEAALRVEVVEEEVPDDWSSRWKAWVWGRRRIISIEWAREDSAGIALVVVRRRMDGRSSDAMRED